MLTHFLRPTLITLTAPTCSGKSFLLDRLIERGCDRIVSTTTRKPREGELEGVDYFYITHSLSKMMEARGEFAEKIEFLGVEYGVTHAEMHKKMEADETPVLVLEPKGLRIYEQYCAAHNWDIFKVFVSTPEDVRIQRQIQRTYHDGLHLIKDQGYFKMKRLIETHTNRIRSILGDERYWFNYNTWDAIVTGEDAPKAIDEIEIAIKWRNRKVSQLNT